MKVYVLKEIEAENNFTDNIAVFLNKDEANIEKEKLSKQNEIDLERAEKCAKCPIFRDSNNKDEIEKYCDECFLIFNEENDYFDCTNCSYGTYVDYVIEEVDLIE